MLSHYRAPFPAGSANGSSPTPERCSARPITRRRLFGCTASRKIDFTRPYARRYSYCGCRHISAHFGRSINLVGRLGNGGLRWSRPGQDMLANKKILGIWATILGISYYNRVRSAPRPMSADERRRFGIDLELCRKHFVVPPRHLRRRTSAPETELTPSKAWSTIEKFARCSKNGLPVAAAKE